MVLLVDQMKPYGILLQTVYYASGVIYLECVVSRCDVASKDTLRRTVSYKEATKKLWSILSCNSEHKGSKYLALKLEW